MLKYNKTKRDQFKILLNLLPTVCGGGVSYSVENAFSVERRFYWTLVSVDFQGEPGKVGAPGYRGDEGPPGPEVGSMEHMLARP